MHIVDASREDEFEASFATLSQLQVAAVVVANDPFFTAHRDQLVALAARHAIPAIYSQRQFPDAGGLLSYEPIFPIFIAKSGFMRARCLRARSLRSPSDAAHQVRVGH
jgi:putative ABC transport system substrate-binding protein